MTSTGRKAIIVFTVFCAAAFHQTAYAADTHAPSAQFDERLFAKLHQANQNEIQAGKLAVRKGQSDAVRAYGDMLITDHGKADRQVMALAKAKGWDLSKATEPKDDSEMAQLKGLNGPDFDARFKRMMIEDHKHDLTELNQGLSQLQDPQEKKVLSGILPTIQHHESWAMKLPSSDGSVS